MGDDDPDALFPRPRADRDESERERRRWLRSLTGADPDRPSRGPAWRRPEVVGVTYGWFSDHEWVVTVWPDPRYL